MTASPGFVFDRARAAVDALLAPISFREWLDVYWGRECFIRADGEGVLPAGLPTEAEFEHLLASLNAPRDGWFSLVKGRARPPDEALLTTDGWLSLPEVFEAYAEGNSLLLNQVQKRHLGLGRLCRELETVLTGAGVLLSRHIGANLYLSPPQSQGFGIHYDPHDVLILQLEGMKHWSLYRTRALNPVEPPSEPFTIAEAGGVAREYTMAPGDIAYIPRGVLHAARTFEQGSLHLTLSIEPATWSDLFAEVMRRSPALREALPVGFATEGSLSSSDRDSIQAKSDAFAEDPSVDEAVRAVWSKLLLRLDRMAGPGPTALGRLAKVDLDTPLQLAEGVFGKVARGSDETVLHLPGASFTAPPWMAEAFEHMLTRASFTARELPTRRPPADCLPFLSMLTRGGHLRSVDPGLCAAVTQTRHRR